MERPRCVSGTLGNVAGLGLLAVAAVWLTIFVGAGAAEPRAAHLASALACGASGGSEPSTFDAWCGTWFVSFQSDTVGGSKRVGPFGEGSGDSVTFTRISQDEGIAATGQDFGRFPLHRSDCDPTPLFYRGTFTWGGGGTVIACTSSGRLVGRFKLDNGVNSDCCRIVQSGDFEIVGGDTSFVGSYSVDDSNQRSFQWSGSGPSGGVPRRAVKVGFRFTQHGHPSGYRVISTQTGGAGGMTFASQPLTSKELDNGKPSVKTKIFHIEHIPGVPAEKLTLDVVSGNFTDNHRKHQFVLNLQTTVQSSTDGDCPVDAPVAVVMLQDFRRHTPAQLLLKGQPASSGAPSCGLKESFASANKHRLSVHVSPSARG